MFWTEQGHLIFHKILLPQVSSLQSVDMAMPFQAFETIPGTPQEKCFSLVCYITQDLRADTTARRRRTVWCCKESSTEKTPSCCCPWPWLQGSSSSTTERQQRGSGHRAVRGSPTDSRAAAPCGSWALGSCTPPVCRAALWDPEEVGAEINDILMISLSGLLLSFRIAGQKTKVENKEEM